jgi:glycosyltransferase involved in cell wall biosynthesis
VQVPVLRAAYRWSERSIFTIDLAKVTWLLGSREKAVFIPVGANLPGAGPLSFEQSARLDGRKEVAVFCVTGGVHAQREAVASVRVVVRGRNSEAAEEPLRAALAGTGVELEIHGVLPPEAVEHRLSQADVLLFVRGGISSRRGSAIAGIVCGLPVVAYSWRETAPPVTEAGVVLVPSGDREALANALSRVLVDDAYRAQLRRRSLAAREKHFSWEAIAKRFVEALR